MKLIRSKPASRHSQRSGATLVEGAIVLGTLLVILLAMVDLGLAVLRYNLLSEAARLLAREAIVHGEMAGPERSVWGPDAYSGTADDGSEYAAVILPVLILIEPEELAIDIEWPDGGNLTDQEVNVTLKYDYQPMLPFVFGSDTYELSATSTTKIAH